MNDRFKFRVWNDMQKCYSPDDHYIDEDGFLNTFGNYVIEQCTGLKDKNGKLVYEGDIIKMLFLNNRHKKKIKNCFLIWDVGRACFTIKADTTDDYRTYESSCSNIFANCEVIGNTHENKELIQ